MPTEQRYYFTLNSGRFDVGYDDVDHQYVALVTQVGETEAYRISNHLNGLWQSLAEAETQSRRVSRQIKILVTDLPPLMREYLALLQALPDEFGTEKLWAKRELLAQMLTLMDDYRR